MSLPLRWILCRILVPAIDQSSIPICSNQQHRVSDLAWNSTKSFATLFFKPCMEWWWQCQKIQSWGEMIFLYFNALGWASMSWTFWLQSLQRHSWMRFPQASLVRCHKHQWRWMDYPSKGKSCRLVAHNATQFCFCRNLRLERSKDCRACGIDRKGTMICSQVQSVGRKGIVHPRIGIRI